MPYAVRRNKGTTVEFKSTSAGTYAAIKGIQNLVLPFPESDAEEVTPLEGPVVIEANTINDYGNAEVEILFDSEDVVHIAMLGCVGSDVDAFLKVTHPNGRTKEFSGNPKGGKDSSRTPKNHTRWKWAMHCNVVPTEVAPP